MKTSKQDRYRGCLMGLAACDAVGTTLEFKPPGTFAPIHDMVGGGPFGLNAGQWTDDTSMALCLAESLIEKQSFDPIDQLERYLRWWKQGHLSSTGRCFDIGNATRAALHEFERTHCSECGSTSENAAGNGSIMRLAPVPMLYAATPALAIQRSGDSSITTHGTKSCIDACRYLGGLIAGALAGESKAALLSDRHSPVEGLWHTEPLVAEIDAVARGSFKRKEPPAIKGSGHVVKSLEAALWAFHKSSTFEEGCLLAVNLGDDADTTGAVYGQIAGAYYGAQTIPTHWRERLAMRELIENMADELRRLSEHTNEHE
jgi:ADP-ribosylglycohydrolase